MDNITPASTISPLTKKFKYEPSRPQAVLSPMRASALDPNFFKKCQKKLGVAKDKILIGPVSPPKPAELPRKNLTELLDIADDSSDEDSLVLAIRSAKNQKIETVSENGESLYDEALHDLNDAWKSDLALEVDDDASQEIGLGEGANEGEEEIDELEDSIASVCQPMDEIVIPQETKDEREAPAKDAIRDLFADLF